MSPRKQIPNPEVVEREGQNDPISPPALPISNEQSMSGEGRALAQSKYGSHYLPLKFRTTKRKPVPIGYIALDQALDELGRKQYPKEWGKSDCWADMPFRWRSGKRGFYYSVTEGRGITKRVRTVVLQGQNDRKMLRQLARLYKRVYVSLSEALERGSIQASVFHPRTGVITTITRPGVWIAQRFMIFYAGYVPEDDRICRVLIEKSSFYFWIRKALINSNSDMNLDLSLAIKQILESWAGEKYKITKANFLDLIDNAFSDDKGLMEVSRYIEKCIWPHLVCKNTSGSPVTAHKTAFNSERKALLASIKVEVQRWQARRDKDHPPLPTNSALAPTKSRKRNGSRPV